MERLMRVHNNSSNIEQQPANQASALTVKCRRMVQYINYQFSRDNHQLIIPNIDATTIPGPPSNDDYPSTTAVDSRLACRSIPSQSVHQVLVTRFRINYPTGLIISIFSEIDATITNQLTNSSGLFPLSAPLRPIKWTICHLIH